MKTKWKSDAPKVRGSYLCRMGNCSIKMCYWNCYEWEDMWESSLKGTVVKWTEIPR